MNIVPSKGAAELVDVGIAKKAPKTYTKDVFVEDNGRVLQEEPNFHDLGLEFRE